MDIGYKSTAGADVIIKNFCGVWYLQSDLQLFIRSRFHIEQRFPAIKENKQGREGCGKVLGRLCHCPG